jgi:hypothetical protein
MSPDGFSLFVYNENNEVVLSERHDTGEQNLISQLNLSCSTLPPFQHVSLITVTDYYSLIPATLFTQSSARDFLRLQHPGLSESSEIYHSYYKYTESVLIYAFDKDKIKAVQAIFPQVNIRHHLHQLIEDTPTLKGEQLSLILRNGKVDCLASHRNSILLINSYIFQTEEDIVYHVLNIIHHLHFDHETMQVTIYLGSNVVVNPEKILKAYVPLINCKNIPSGI